MAMQKQKILYHLLLNGEKEELTSDTVMKLYMLRTCLVLSRTISNLVLLSVKWKFKLAHILRQKNSYKIHVCVRESETEEETNTHAWTQRQTDRQIKTQRDISISSLLYQKVVPFRPRVVRLLQEPRGSCELV